MTGVAAAAQNATNGATEAHRAAEELSKTASELRQIVAPTGSRNIAIDLDAANH